MACCGRLDCAFASRQCDKGPILSVYIDSTNCEFTNMQVALLPLSLSAPTGIYYSKLIYYTVIATTSIRTIQRIIPSSSSSLLLLLLSSSLGWCQWLVAAAAVIVVNGVAMQFHPRNRHKSRMVYISCDLQSGSIESVTQRRSTGSGVYSPC